jgi:type 2 lantibiotic biosynthesis protein LanM
VPGGDGHGWAAFVRQAPLTGPEQAGTYFRRVGGLLALLHLVRATDMHHQNLVASGDQPMLVDVETLFQPSACAGAADPAAAALAESVARTGLLPAAAGRHGLTDISGVGGDPGQPTAALTTDWVDAGTDRMRVEYRTGRVAGAANRVVLAGRPVEAADHAAAVETGFAAVYDAICRHRGEFAGLLRAAAALPVRVVPRPTRHYTALLAKASAPGLLGDMRERERVLRSALVPGPEGLVDTEVADLTNGDIPLVTTRADAAAPWPGAAGVTDGSGLDAALTRLGSFGELDRRDQQWVIAAALASRGTADPGPAETVALEPSAAGSDELLSAACAIGDRIISVLLGGAGVNWLGLEPVTDRRWLVLPMGAGLAHGYTGVALFLAQLAEISAVHRYRDVARRVLAPVPALLAALRGQRDPVAAVGAGLSGFGGIGYALARLSTLLDAAEVAGWAEATVPLAGEAASMAPVSGWADGLAGCAVAMRSIADEIGSAEAHDLAERCVDELRAEGGDTPADRHAIAVLTGDAATVAGTVSSAGPRWWCPDSRDSRYSRDSTASTARTESTASAESAPEELLAAEAERPVSRDLTLCHGELGRTDVLAALGPSVGYDRVTPVLRRRAGTVLAVLRRDGPRCATPGGVHTPGLLCGSSGIGYGLLRLGFPDRVPSALLLAPTPR